MATSALERLKFDLLDAFEPSARSARDPLSFTYKRVCALLVRKRLNVRNILKQTLT